MRWCGVRSSTASGSIISAGASSKLPTTSAAWARCPATPSCSTGWPAGSSTTGESLKELHRLIVTSAVYRQSSQCRADYAELDSGNRYLWRMNRQRLEAEASTTPAAGRRQARLEDGRPRGPSCSSSRTITRPSTITHGSISDDPARLSPRHLSFHRPQRARSVHGMPRLRRPVHLDPQAERHAHLAAGLGLVEQPLRGAAGRTAGRAGEPGRGRSARADRSRLSLDAGPPADRPGDQSWLPITPSVSDWPTPAG